MLLKRLFLATLLYLGFCAGLSAQDTESTALDQYSLKAWEALKDIPASQIWDLAQDKTGYLWLATDAGILRYDGFRFHMFNMANVQAFQSDEFKLLEIDPEGKVWVSNGNELFFWDGTTFKAWENKTKEALTSISELKTDTLSRLWLISAGQIFCIDEDNVKSITPGITNAFSLARGKASTMWVGTLDARLFSFADHVATEYSEVTSSLQSPIRAIVENEQGALFLGLMAGGLYRFANDQLHPLFQENQHLWTSSARKLTIDRDGSLWIGSNRGVFKVSKDQIHQYSYEKGLIDPRVRSLLADKNGNIWVGTYNGLNALNHTPVRLSKAKGVASNLHAVFEDSQKKIWALGATCGATLWNGSTLIRPKGHSLLSVDIRSMAELPNGNLLFGTRDGLIEATYEQETINPVKKLSHNWVTIVFAASNGEILYSELRNGIENRVYKISAADQTRTEIIQGDVGLYWVHENAKNDYWLSTTNGLYRMKGGNLKRYGQEDGLFASTIRDYWRSGEGEFWFATGNAGLVRFAKGEFTSFNTKNGFPVNDVSKINLSPEGLLSFGTQRAIYRTSLNAFRKAVLKDSIAPFFYEKHDIQGGLSHWGFPASLASTKGLQLFTGGRGLISLERGLENRSTPQIIFESVLANGKSLSVEEEIELSTNLKNLAIHYTAIDFISAEELIFQYKLEGYDDDWHTVDSRRTANYSSLPAGNFTFKVRLLGSDTEPASLTFIKPPLWWQSNEAVVAAIVLIIIVVRVLWYLRIKAIKAKNIKLESIVNEQTEELQQLLSNLEDKVKERTLELDKTNERLTYALEVSIDDIWDWDLISDSIQYSDSIYKILGYERREIEITRKTFIDLRHPDSKEPDTTEEQYTRARKIGTYTFTSEFQLLHKNGHYIWVQSKGKAVAWDEDGLATRMVGTNTDITAEKEREQKILETVITTEDNERTRISHEIHDGLQQTLTISSLNLEYLKRELDNLGPLAREKFITGWEHLQKSITESRNVAHALMPKAINDYGLVSALESLFDELNHGADGVEFLFDHNLAGKEITNPAIEVSFYRIAQEATNNIIKYAKASRVMIQLKNYDDLLMLTVEDNGVGFDLEEKRQSGSMFGLKSMENRIAAIAGHIEIDSRPGRGTSIIVQVTKEKLQVNGSIEIDAG